MPLNSSDMPLRTPPLSVVIGIVHNMELVSTVRAVAGRRLVLAVSALSDKTTAILAAVSKWGEVRQRARASGGSGSIWMTLSL